MHSTNAQFFISLIISLTGFAATTPNRNMGKTDSRATAQAIDRFPKVEVVLALKDTVLHYGDRIYLNISLKNKGNEPQKVLFDQPALSTGGPWAMSGRVTDIKTNRSVLKYENKAVVSSQLYTEDELNDKYYDLQHGQSIQRQYALSDIVVFDAANHCLPKGTYHLQLFYYSNPSNVVTFKIK